MVNMKSGNSSAVTRSTFCNVEAPRLGKIDTASIRSFLRQRKEYEQLVREKNNDSHTNVALVSLKSSISDAVLNILCKAQFVSAANKEQITDEMLKETLVERMVVNFVSLRSDEIERMVGNVKMDMSIKDCKTRVWQLVIDYESALSAEGYQGVLEKCPQTAIKHIRERTRPLVLQEKMVQVLQTEKRQGRHYNQFYDFIRRLVQEAEIVEMEGYEEPAPIESVKKDPELLPLKNVTETESAKANEGAAMAAPCEAQLNGPSKVKTPFCWNKQKCFGQRHRLKQCPNTSAIEKKKIFQRAMRRKYGRNAKKVKAKIENVRIINIDKHSIMFKVSFADAVAHAVQGSTQLTQMLTSKRFDLRHTIEALRMGAAEMHDD